MKVYAIIPARSGSVGYKDKNIKKIDNKPLLAYSIEFAKELKCVDRIFCSTDSQKYANIAIKYGAEVPFLRSVESSILIILIEPPKESIGCPKESILRSIKK